jgi:uncharacterized protein YkwD
VGAPSIKTRLKNIRLVASGPIRPRDFALIRDKVSIGSAAVNDLVIEEETVSRRHASLLRHGGELRLSDLGSTNGTYLNGRRVTSPTVVHGGDELRFGSVCYMVRDDPASAGRSPHVTTIAAAVAILLVAGFALTRAVISRDQFKRTAQGGRTKEQQKPAVVGNRTASAQSPSATVTEAADGKPAITPPMVAWLGLLNYYRSLAGIPPVEADAELSAGDAAHARYLVKNYGKDRGHGLGAAAHSEDPAMPWYTASGYAAAAASNVNEEYDSKPGRFDAAKAIDGWISIPFHRLWILNPGLRRAGYGQYCEAGACAGALNVLSGADPMLVTPKTLERPIEFPPDGTTLKLRSAEDEWPDPLTACPGYVPPMGLAITLQLGALTEAKLSAFSLTLNGRDPEAIEACGFDAGSYVNPDPAQQRRVRDILRDFGAVVVVPRAPLRPGIYAVSITAAGRLYAWSFRVTG